MTLFKKLFLSPVNSSVHYLVNCFAVCLYAFDTVQDCSNITNNTQKLPKSGTAAISFSQSIGSSRKNTFRKYFIPPVILWLLLAADYLRIHFDFLQHDNSSRLPFSKNPAFLTHRMYTPALWAQGDMVVLAVSTGFLLLGLALSLRKNWLNTRYCMLIIKDKNDAKKLVINGRGTKKKHFLLILNVFNYFFQFCLLSLVC